jgi:predicted GNAT superfamily acetyltransferase
MKKGERREGSSHPSMSSRMSSREEKETTAGLGGAGEEAYEIRAFRSLEQCRECVTFQELIWGEGFSERVPATVLWMTQDRLGGVAAGAYDREGRLVGFVFGMTGVEDGEPVHWSDMLGVRPGLRDSGLGTRLKLFQREALLSKGVRRARWSFDPLESRNAYLNLERLGTVAREYVENMYGESDSPLHRGLGTDRLVVLWELDSPRVLERIAGGGERATGVGPAQGAKGLAGESSEERSVYALAARVPRESRAGPSHLPAPGEPSLGLTDVALSVAIPSQIQEVKRRDSVLARRWREATRAVLAHYLARGWEVHGLRRQGPVSYLQLRRTTP